MRLPLLWLLAGLLVDRREIMLSMLRKEAKTYKDTLEYKETLAAYIEFFNNLEDACQSVR